MKNIKKRFVPLRCGEEVELKKNESAALLEWSVKAQSYSVRRKLSLPPVSIQNISLLTNPDLSFGKILLNTPLETIEWIYGPSSLIEQLFKGPQRSWSDHMRQLLKEKASIEKAISTEKRINIHSGELSFLENGSLRQIETSIAILRKQCQDQDIFRAEIKKALNKTIEKREKYQQTARDLYSSWDSCLRLAKTASQREKELLHLLEASLDALTALSLGE